MKTVICAALLSLATAMPAAAQSTPQETPSDRYTRDPAQIRRDEQAQAQSERRRAGEVETLRRDNMSAPNIKGEQVPEDTSTGAAAPEQRGHAKKTEGAIRP